MPVLRQNIDTVQLGDSETEGELLGFSRQSRHSSGWRNSLQRRRRGIGRIAEQRFIETQAFGSTQRNLRLIRLR